MPIDPADIILPDGRNLATLKVVDLKEQLNQLNLSKVGNKKELMMRLASVYSVEAINTSQIVESETSFNDSRCADKNGSQTSSNLDQSLKDTQSEKSIKNIDPIITDDDDPPDSQINSSIMNHSENVDLIQPVDDAPVIQEIGDKLEAIKETQTVDSSISPKISSKSSAIMEEADPSFSNDSSGNETHSIINIETVKQNGNNDQNLKTKKRKWGVNKSQLVEMSVCSETLDQLIPTVIPNPRSIDDILNEVNKPPSAKVSLFKKDENSNQSTKSKSLKSMEDPEVNSSLLPSSDLRNQIHRTDSKSFSITSSESIDAESAILDEETERVFKSQPARPAVNDVSEFVYITCLVRPYNAGQLYKMLQKNYGKVEELWLDNVKSQAIVKFENGQVAQKCREEVDGSKWPKINPRILKVEFCTETLLVWMKTYGQKGDKLPPKSVLYPSKRGKMSRDDDKLSITTNGISENMNDQEVTMLNKDLNEPIEVDLDAVTINKENEMTTRKDETSPTEPLDTLFKFTSTNPKIYWKPLTKEQADEQQKRRLEEFERKLKCPSPSPSPRFRRNQPRRRSPRRNYPLRRRPSPRNYKSSRRYSRSPFRRR